MREASLQEGTTTFTADLWGPVKIDLDDRTFEAWRPLRRPQDEEPARERNDEDAAGA